MEKQCDAVKSILKDILALKKTGATRQELKALITRAALELVKLKIVNRTACEDTEKHRVETALAKAQLDQTSLQLQNLLYEKNYYNKEISACRSFRSKYSKADLELISQEEYLSAVNDALNPAEDAHKFFLQRLAHEKQQRQAALKGLEDVKGRKDAQEQVVAGKRKFLEDLQQDLGRVKEAALPLTEHLQLPNSSSADRYSVQAAASLLPLPLYLLYSQLVATKDAFGIPIEVSFAGSEKDAEGAAQAAGAAILGSSTPEEASKKRRRTDAAASTGEPDRKAHPLSVQIELRASSNTSLALQFFYVPALELVTVGCADDQHAVLGSLFTGDDGLKLPSEAAQQLVEGGGFELHSHRTERPYRWAQHLAGLDFLPALTAEGALAAAEDAATLEDGLSTYRKQRRVMIILQRMQTVASTAAARPPLSPAPAAVNKAAPAKRPVKRIRTFDEIVQERSRPATPAVSAAPNITDADKPSSGAQQPAIADMESEEEEGALPEEGELS